MNRRDFLLSSLAATVCTSAAKAAAKKDKSPFLFGVCCGFNEAPLLKSVGYDFIENNVASSLIPDKGDDDWKIQRDKILSLAVPLRSCNGFIPGRFRLTGPKADFAPALDYAEIALR